MRLSVRCAVATLALLPAVLTAQVQVPPDPTIPALPAITGTHAANSPQFVGSACAAERKLVAEPGTQNSSQGSVPQYSILGFCSSGRLLYDYDPTPDGRVRATLYLTHNVHPWAQARQDFYVNIGNNHQLFTAVGLGRPSGTNLIGYLDRGVGGQIGAVVEVLTSSFVLDGFGGSVTDYTQLRGVGAEMTYYIGRNGSMGPPTEVALRLSFTPVPEPSTYALFGTGLATLGLVARRRRRAA